MRGKERGERDHLLANFFRDRLFDVRDFSAVPDNEKAAIDRSYAFAVYVFENALAEFKAVFFECTWIGKWITLMFSK